MLLFGPLLGCIQKWLDTAYGITLSAVATFRSCPQGVIETVFLYNI